MSFLPRTISLGATALPLLASGCVLFGTDEDDLPAQDTLGQVSQIALGRKHSCAMGKDGTLRCWGLNDVGQLGDGTKIDRSTPVPVRSEPDGPPLTGVQALALGGYHSCALLEGGTVQCWGANGLGQLGDGTTSNRNTPVPVRSAPNGPLLTGVLALALGGSHSCALLEGDTVQCWGANGYGQLGDGERFEEGSPVYQSTPVSVRSGPEGAPLTGVQALALGYDHSCALLGGTVQCWGANGYGQLGDGMTSHRRSTPVPVVSAPKGPSLTGVRDLALGGYHSCALLDDGTVRCWGYNGSGQLGNGTTSNWSSTPLLVRSELGGAPLAGVQALALGGSHSCALLEGGTVQCWGDKSAWGRFRADLGNELITSGTTTVRLLLTEVRAFALGDDHSCAVLDEGTVRCRGSNEKGQLGVSTASTPRVTAPVVLELYRPSVIRRGSGGGAGPFLAASSAGGISDSPHRNRAADSCRPPSRGA
ncbi:MAG TPA: hypothetical protein VFS43_32470 [Polyangiaceae bacterium]|nr:hypothetical protein [Polyangiaceae bacterium]